MEFWNDEVTMQSWSRLIELSKEIEMVVIGGWAVYLYTGLSKSKDIDIIIDYSTLRKLASKYSLVKNDLLFICTAFILETFFRAAFTVLMDIESLLESSSWVNLFVPFM